MPRRMAGLVTWRRGTGMSPSLRRGAVANVVVAASLLMLLHRWDSPHGGEGAGVAAFVFVSLRHTAQMAQTDFGTSSDRSTRGVDATPPTALAAASKGGGGAISRGRKSSGSSKSGGGFGKVATRPVPEDQGGLGRQRSAAAVSPPNEHGEGLVDSTVVLDKWGLPPPTIDDIFPPLPEGTELVHVGSSANHTLEQIQDALRHVVPLTLDRHFDEFGVERDSAAGRSGRSEPDHDSGRQRRAMKLRLLHQSPPVLAIENFFTPAECEATRRVVEAPSKPSAAAGGGPSPPVQVGSRTFVGAISRRTSTSWFCCYEQHPVLLAKAVHVLGLELPNMEEPQVVRYQPGQEFSFHYDQVPAHQTDNGGQRLATLLVYLNTVESSGGTQFRDLKGPDGASLTVRPRQGSALLFFPADASGAPDDRTLHCGEPLAEREEKWIVQMWIHQHRYRASVPPHNRQEDAMGSIEATARQLGLIP